MSYAKLLNDLIGKSGMTAKEIAEKCTEQGQKITASYLSILRNADSKRIPSEDISRALAKVLGVDENLLLVEAFLDNAPPVLVKALRNVYAQTFEAAFKALGQGIPPEERPTFLDAIAQIPLSEFVLQLSSYDTPFDYDNEALVKTELVDDTHYNIQMQIQPEFDVLDNAMEPKLPKGSRVKIKMQNEYKSGDIIAFKEKGSKKLQYRKLGITKKGEQMLVAFHSDYDVIEYDSYNTVILGRVEAVITQI